MIRIIAYTREEGYVFFEEDEAFYFTRPPYREFEPQATDKGEHLVRCYDYCAGGSEDILQGRNALSTWIGAKREQYASESPSEKRSPEERFSILVTSAPPYILERYLNRLEKEIIPRGELEKVKKILKIIASQRERLPANLTERLDALLAQTEGALVPNEARNQ